jgi:hypothetical protein
VQNPEVQEWLQTYKFKFAKEINKRSDVLLRDAITSGLDAGEGVPAISKRIQKNFTGKIGKKRAKIIARTEVKRAATRGQIEAWRQSGVVTAKVWVAFADRCPWCAEMESRFGKDGEHIPFDATYFDEGQGLDAEDVEREVRTGETEVQRGGRMNFNYEPVVGPPLHPNCRCTLQSVVIEP